MENVNNELATTSENPLSSYKEKKAFGAVFETKPDTATRVYPKRVIIKKEDLDDLNSKIIKKYNLHNINSEFCSITISFESRKSLCFDGWDSFKNYDWSENSCVKNIILTWDFSVKLATYQNVQRHKLKVKISAGLSPEEILNLVLTGKIENMKDLDMEEFPIIAQMDYIDSLLCNEFLNLVGEWVQDLSISTDNKKSLIGIMQKHRSLVARYFEYVFPLLCLFLGFTIINYKMLPLFNQSLAEINFGNIMKLFDAFGILFLFVLIIYICSKNIAIKVFEFISEYNRFYVFEFTKEDSNRQKNIYKKNKKIKQNVFVRITISIILNVTVSLISSYILGLIK